VQQGVPHVLIYILLLLAMRRDITSHEDLDFAELFSGEGMVTRGLRERHFKGSPFELRLNPLWDFNSTVLGVGLPMGSER
jgi:hypothetical protein